jgi:hypothetical protein
LSFLPEVEVLQRTISSVPGKARHLSMKEFVPLMDNFINQSPAPMLPNLLARIPLQKLQGQCLHLKPHGS